MRQISSTASVLVSGFRGAIGALVTFIGPSCDGSVRKYHPEQHYMRGPGPKWREKHFLDPRIRWRRVSFPVPSRLGTLVVTGGKPSP
jgi:hypothetical protein